MRISVMRIGVFSLLLGCNTGTTDEDSGHGFGAQHNVTEGGIVVQPRTPDGNFEPPVASAAAGWWEMRVGGEQMFLPKGPRSPDLSVYHFGRGDLQYPTAKTSVGVSLSGLGPWQEGDTLQLVSPNVGLAISGLDTHFAYP